MQEAIDIEIELWPVAWTIKQRSRIRVDVSLLSAELAAFINAASNYLLAGEIPEPQGSAHSAIVPYQAFRASDGYLMIGAANDKLFRHVCQALGHPE